MKILAINGSPKGKLSCTHIILAPLLEGMQKAGAETQVIYLSELNIKHCLGCFACWKKTPGICVIKDDMAKALPKLIEADMVIYGTPLYTYDMTGMLKNFLDRQLPLTLPAVEKNKALGGITTLLARYQTQPKKMLLVSPCGLPELSHFDALIFTFKKIAEQCQEEYLGEILRPAAEVLRSSDYRDRLALYQKQLFQAGQQLIKANKIEESLLQALHAPMLSLEEYYRLKNA